MALLPYLVFAAAGLLSLYAIVSSWFAIKDQIQALLSMHFRDKGVEHAITSLWAAILSANSQSQLMEHDSMTIFHGKQTSPNAGDDTGLPAYLEAAVRYSFASRRRRSISSSASTNSGPLIPGRT